MKKIMGVLSVALTLTVAAPTEAAAQTRSVKKKSTIIGAGAGAATGVLVSRNNSKGAVVGGVVGAGAGYMYGRHKDKKRGVVKKRY
jgi:uncharacterized membrane protein